MTKPLTVPLAEAARHNGAALAPASRPSPPSSRPMRLYQPPPQLHALRPPSEPERGHVAKSAEKKQRRTVLDPAQKAKLVAKVFALYDSEPSTPKNALVERVSKEASLSPSTLKKAMIAAEAERAKGKVDDSPPKLRIEGLEDLIAWHIRRAMSKAWSGK